MVKGNDIGASFGQGGIGQVLPEQSAMAQLALQQFAACDCQHLGATVDADALAGVACQQFKNSSGTGSHVDQPVTVQFAKHVADCLFDFFFWYIELLHRIPGSGHPAEVISRLFDAFLLNTAQALPVAGSLQVAIRIKREHGADQCLRVCAAGMAVEHPAAFRVADQQAIVRKDPQVTADTRLTHGQYFAQLTDGEFTDTEHVQYAQAGGFTESP